jgi:hypothetical protein
MSDPGITTFQQLYQGILDGKVPRQVRLFTAQGMLPVPREELFCLQLLLSADPDPELATVAVESLKQHPETVFVEWLDEPEIPPMALDLLIRVREEEPVWAAVASHPGVSDETLRVLARHGPVSVQDIIITNQIRIMDCLEILEDLKANPRIAQVVLRRVREFEEEFIEKAIRQQARLEEAEAANITIEQALAALRAIGAHIPLEEQLPYSTLPEPEVEAELERLRLEGMSVFGRIAHMNVKQKILCALKGSREERAILINSRNRLVVHSVLASPKLSDSEVERYAQSRSVPEEALRIISSNRRWMQMYGVILALVQNPKAPLQTSLRVLAQLNARDLGRVITNRNVHPVVRKRAKEFKEVRR